LLQENNVTLTTHIRKYAPLLALATALPALAQSTVVYSTPNDIVVKRADGQLINYTVAAGSTISVAGKKVPASEIKPGTKLTDPIPGDGKVVTGISTATGGKVYQVSPPDKVTLSLASGIKEVTVPAGTSFTVGGKKVGISELKKDMTVDATIVATTSGSDATGNTPPSSTPALAGPIVLDIAGGDDLPAAGTNLPLYGGLGVIILALGLALRSNRFASNRA
jgi:hypothetical protein